MKRNHQLFLLLLFCTAGTDVLAQQLYTATGRASYYASRFDGRKTANGEIFSNKKLTAAHLTLPFGTILKVTNLKNNKSVVVRINDRGPYIKSRIIDLSHAAADSIDIIHSGWAMVKLEELMPERLDTTPSQPEPLAYAEQLRFPEDWIGKWGGTLRYFSERGLEKRENIQLTIQPVADSHRLQWLLVMDTLKLDYELVLRDSSMHFYSMDHKNGIDVMSTLFGNHLMGRFNTMGSMQDFDYELLNRKEMNLKIVSGNNKVEWTTGNINDQSEFVPEIEVYKITGIQVARLQRISN